MFTDIVLATLRLLSVFASDPGKPSRLSRELRLGLVVLGLGSASLLVVAAYLRPSPLGFGTHQQLGLPPCTFVALWNLPCPSCGMTTAFANVVRGNLLAALRANVAGTILAVCAILLTAWALGSAAWGRFVVQPPKDRTLIIGALALVVITLLDWAHRIAWPW